MVPTALAVRVHVRVEGKTRTIFGPTAPMIDVTSPRANPLPENALDALATASALGEFYYHVTTTSFGPYVDQVGLFPAVGQTGWVFKVNGQSPPVGADQVRLKAGDTVLWYWAQFGVAGGPKTLVLSRVGKTQCYRVQQQDDNGNLTPALGAVLKVGKRTSQDAGQHASSRWLRREAQRTTRPCRARRGRSVERRGSETSRSRPCSCRSPHRLWQRRER